MADPVFEPRALLSNGTQSCLSLPDFQGFFISPCYSHPTELCVAPTVSRPPATEDTSVHNFSVAEAGYHLEFGPNPWDVTVDSSGQGLSYSDPDSPWSSFAPDTPPCVGIVTSAMPLTPQGSSFGISGDDPGENEQHKFPTHHNEEKPTVNPSHLDMSHYQATYDTEIQDSGSYINTQACSYSPFSGLGPSGPPPIPQTYSEYSFDQPVEAYQTSDPPLTGKRDFNQYGSAEVAGAHPPPLYASSS
ncbi:hypothetical protein NCU05869 [Neurospora crassa OR74A]|uniref:Uncharacterized protein n=1 Tax=Neurospora crassa (strain ATCC 24698 / 74-OR23-1A / CBS 708.71 / DSM 1257 / FGSC 987) TaxID=367110 RepID=Q7S539_NEUCR|nr:hypothetical protein NCU05869 [Neurospora crassa OR74A]EAA30624.1 hypothetical protein NCU05869 [Neurospora crassa OR74A]|eukprot:XP_959860.1 hypothetical protein NCU05869 [Neurospora crassa OR74A]